MTKEEFTEVNARLSVAETKAEEHGIKLRKVRFDNKMNPAEVETLFKVSLMRFLGSKMQYLPEYDKVIGWLKENSGKSLILMGKCGVGKSVIACKVIPTLLSDRGIFINPLNAKQFAKSGVIQDRRFWIVDDLGTEGIVKDYGTEVDKIGELLDHIDLIGGTALITTNLNQEQIMKQYGGRNYDRFKNFEFIVIDHESMRGQKQ